MIDERKVEKIARLMCAEFGLNPDHLVWAQHTCLHSAGSSTWRQQSSPTAHISVNGQNVPLVVDQGARHVPRWFLFKEHAQLALAYQNAFNKFFLTEDHAA